MNQDASGRSIRPADFQSPDQVKQSASTSAAHRKPFPFKATGVIGLLLILALATLLYLPEQVGNSPGNSVGAAPTVELPPEAIEQPFTDSQLLRARSEAQDILAELIGIQSNLEILSVSRWAGSEYQSVLDIASRGDTAYQRREFDQALDSYRSARDAARDILNRRGEYAEREFDLANQAFAAGDSTTALAKYELALELDPGNQMARQGIERSRVLDQVYDLKELATTALANGNRALAISNLQKATELDPMDSDAKNQLAAVREEVRQQSFREKLAEGFNALSDGRYTDARYAFQQAEELVPDTTTVTDALLQVDSAAETSQRSELMDQALIAESREEWDQAAQHYRELLERESSNVAARVGLVRVEARAELDLRIREILDDPLALQSDARWNEAEITLADARAIIDKTPVLVRQISDLERVIQQARTPVELQLLSDGLTQIEIYRIGIFGTLREHRVNIYPGEYVVIGRRSGYRDIRRELVVEGGTESISLRVEAVEPINR